MPLRTLKRGRFLIFDPSNNTAEQDFLEKSIKEKYPLLQVTKHISDDWLHLWPKEYPWTVAGVLLRSKKDIDRGLREHLWLLAPYVINKEEILFPLISELEFGLGKIKFDVSKTMVSQSLLTKVHSGHSGLVRTLLYWFALILLNTSFVTSLIEERKCGFRHQQMLAGLSPLIFWAASLFWDVFLITLMSSI
ncbi:unnamed protein product, partial [Cylicocyclus nassatus]